MLLLIAVFTTSCARPLNIFQKAPVSTPALVAVTAENSPTATLRPPTATSLPPSQVPEINILKTQVSPIDGMVMVYVPEGPFLMGSPDGIGQANEHPMHSVHLDAYWIDQTEVTSTMFRTFIESNNYQTDAEKAGESYVFISTRWSLVKGADWRHPTGQSSDITGLEDHPVGHISWNDANAYCAWAERELPTEAQWEKAARGQDGFIYPWGNEFHCSYGNFDDETVLDDFLVEGGAGCDGYEKTSPVGVFEAGASPYGALDMAGNVWEWAADWYGDYPTGAVTNPTGPAIGDYRVLRGGSWFNHEENLRTAYRGLEVPDAPYYVSGFRCALSASASP